MIKKFTLLKFPIILPVIFIAGTFLMSFRYAEKSFPKNEAYYKLEEFKRSSESNNKNDVRAVLFPFLFPEIAAQGATHADVSITAPSDVEGVTSSDSEGDCTTVLTLGTPTSSDDAQISVFVNDKEIDPKTYKFPVGTTSVTWIATDPVTNEKASDTQNVTVVDNEKPVINLSQGTSITQNADVNSCGAFIDLGATATDNCSVGIPTGTRSDSLPIDAEFPVGTTKITWNVTDDNGIPADPIEQTIVVLDEQIPVIANPEKIERNADPEKCGADISITPPSVSENCEGGSPAGIRSDGEALTDIYPVGSTTIFWNFEDSNRNDADQVEQLIIVTDSQLPVITDPSDITQKADMGACDASILIAPPTITDNCSINTPTGTRDDTLALTDPFPVGSTIITWEVTDVNSNAAISVKQEVTVTDDQLPVISAPSDITQIADNGACGASISITPPLATDNCLVNVPTGTRDDNKALTDPFPVGSTIITWEVTDVNSNTAIPVKQEVTVTDNQLPVIEDPVHITQNTDTGICGASINIAFPTVTDNCSVGTPSGSRSDGKALTDIFPVGTTTITWNISDENENAAIPVEQTVTVQDNELPVINPPSDITFLTSTDGVGDCFAFLNLTAPVAVDNCAVGKPTGSRSDGKSISEIYPIGTTTITWTVSDANGNPAIEVKQQIIVEDDEDPIPPTLENITVGCPITLTPPVAYDNCASEIIGTTGNLSFSSGTHTVIWRFTDTSGNYSEASQEVIIDPIVWQEPSVTHVLCNGNSTGAITVEASGGVGPYTYTWGSLGTGATKTALLAGTYSVTATDTNGCISSILEVIVEEPETFIEIINVSSTSGCFGMDNGTATVTASGGTGDYTYLWSNGDTTQTASNLAPGNHTVTVTDENGCSKQRQVVVSQPTELKIAGFLTTETTFYGSATGTATVQISGGTPNYSFSWSDPNNQTTQTARNLAAGTYTVTVTDANGCSTTDTVLIVDSLDANILATSVCLDEDNLIRTSKFSIANGTARGGTPDSDGKYTYEWTFGEGAISESTTGPGPHTVNYEFIGDKTITVKITDSKGLIFNQTIVQYVGGCFADDCGSNDLGLDGYFIGDSDKNKITSENCNSTDQRFIYINFPTEAERYSLNIEVIYSVQNLQTYEITNHKVVGCYFNNAAIPTVAQTFPIDYNCGDDVKIEGVYLTFQNNIKDECGATKGNGNNPKCYSTNNEATVSSPLYAVAFPNQLLCHGENSGMITVRASGGTPTYLYSLNDGDFQESNIFEAIRGGVHKIKVKDKDGEIFPLTTEILKPTTSLSLETTSTPVTCFGGNDGTATVKVSGGTPDNNGNYIYVWTNIGQTTPTATNLVAGDYTVEVTDSNGCTTSLGVTITEPAEVIAIAGPDQVLSCGTSTTLLEAQFEAPAGSPEEIGTWSIVNGPEGAYFDKINDPKTKFTGGSPGTYTLRWSVPCGSYDDVKISIENCSTIDFDGVDDYIDFGNNFNLSGDFSVEGWIKQDVSSTSGIKTLFAKRDSNDYSAGGFDLSIENNYPSFKWNGQGVTSEFPISSSRWYHIAVISNSGGTDIYVDGILVTKNAEAPEAVPETIDSPFLMGAAFNATTPEIPKNFFDGWMEEVRIWNTALTEDQLRFMMNQHVFNNNGKVRGEIIPIDVPGNLSWDKLIGYYYLDNAQNGITKGVEGTPSPDGRLINITTTQTRSAPLPYVTVRPGDWGDMKTATTPWKFGEGIWDQPNSTGVNGAPIDWNIAKISSNLNSGHRNITLLGLISEKDKLSVPHITKANEATNKGQSIRITHYLGLNGVIDLIGDSQLLQDEKSILESTGTGYVQRDQQGTRNSFKYNYWTSPVSHKGPTTNSGYMIKKVMRDGTFPENPKDINFNYQYHWADGPRTSPIKISSYWLYKFFGAHGKYSNWSYVGPGIEGNDLSKLKTGEGFSMKGSAGNASITDLQNYTFDGLPNNGTIQLPITTGQNYLVGNPYPSAIDAKEFILDNLGGKRDGKNIFNGSLYFWDHFAITEHILEGYIGGYAVYNLSGGVKAIASDARINTETDKKGVKRPGQFIPVGQAFFVNATLDAAIKAADVPVSVDGGLIEFRNRQRVFRTENPDSTSVFLSQEQLPLQKKEKVEKQIKIWLKFESPTGYHRQLLVTADKDASDGFDLGYDAPLIDNAAEDMYWLFNEVKLVIQGVPNFNKDRVLPLGVKIEKNTEFTISIDELKDVPDEMEIYLKDKLLEELHDLRASDYKSTSETGLINNRFELVFQADDTTPDEGEEESEEGEEEGQNPDEGETGGEQGGGGEEEIPTPEEGEPVLPGELTIFYSHLRKEIVILNPDLIQLTNAHLANALGQHIVEYPEIQELEETQLPVGDFGAGVYIITVNSEKGPIVRKLIIE